MALLDRFRPAWKHSEPEVRRAAIAELDSDEILAELAKTDPDLMVRAEATARLDDQATLAEIALGSDDLTVRRRAVLALTDAALLQRLALEHAETAIRVAAVGQLTGASYLSTLIQVAVTDEVAEVRREAVGLLQDQAVLTRVVEVDTDRATRQLALSKLWPESVKKLSETHPHAAVRAEAAQALAELGNTGSYPTQARE